MEVSVGVDEPGDPLQSADRLWSKGLSTQTFPDVLEFDGKHLNIIGKCQTLLCLPLEESLQNIIAVEMKYIDCSDIWPNV